MSLTLALLVSQPLSSQRPVASPLKAAQKEQQQRNIEDHVAQTDHRATDTLASSIDKLSAEIAARNTHEASEQRYQLAATDSWALANTGAVTLATIALAVLAYRQWRAMQQQAQFMRHSLASSQRPWLTASIVIDGELFIFSDGRAELAISPLIDNVGQSVAFDINVVLEVMALNTSADLDRMQSGLKALSRPSGEDGFAMFPGGRVDKLFSLLRISANEMNGGPLPAIQTRIRRFTCIGAVFYRFETSERDHSTRFACVLRAEAKTGTASGIHVAEMHIALEPQPQLTRAD